MLHTFSKPLIIIPPTAPSLLTFFLPNLTCFHYTLSYSTYAGTASQKRRQNLLFSNTDAWDDRLAVEESRIFGSLASRSDSFDRQKKLIKDALKHVQKVADADEDLQWDDADPAEHEARAHALAEMMGIVETEEEQDSPIGRRKDASEMRAKRCRDVVEAIRGCRTLPCINYAHSRGEGPATFNFPHFFIIGWQKTATTSLFHYLIRHPQINRPWEKEPEFFSETCGYRVPEGCPANATVDYIKRILRATRYTGYDGQFATFEASTHYSRNGHLMAEALRELFPWLKVVASLRDPISRAASMLVHLVDKNIARGGCLGKHNMDLGYCLLKNSQIQGDPSGGPTEYALPLRAWLEAFPRDQIFMMQVRMFIISLMI